MDPKYNAPYAGRWVCVNQMTVYKVLCGFTRTVLQSDPLRADGRGGGCGGEVGGNGWDRVTQVQL